MKTPQISCPGATLVNPKVLRSSYRFEREGKGGEGRRGRLIGARSLSNFVARVSFSFSFLAIHPCGLNLHPLRGWWLSCFWMLQQKRIVNPAWRFHTLPPMGWDVVLVCRLVSLRESHTCAHYFSYLPWGLMVFQETSMIQEETEAWRSLQNFVISKWSAFWWNRRSYPGIHHHHTCCFHSVS